MTSLPSPLRQRILDPLTSNLTYSTFPQSSHLTRQQMSPLPYPPFSTPVLHSLVVWKDNIIQGLLTPFTLPSRGGPTYLTLGSLACLSPTSLSLVPHKTALCLLDSPPVTPSPSPNKPIVYITLSTLTHTLLASRNSRHSTHYSLLLLLLRH